MNAMTQLIAANALFVLSHFAMSHPLRPALVRTLSDRGFMTVYSLVSLALFAWIVIAFRAAGTTAVATGEVAWVIASVLTITATALLLGSFAGNPALPGTGADAVSAARATGAFAVTRHPMMLSIALWALAHVTVWPSPRTLVTAGSMAVLALVGSALQDRKKRAILGGAWAAWEARTSFWPRLGKLGGLGAGAWIGAIVLWLGFTWLHIPAAGIPAGVWLWIN